MKTMMKMFIPLAMILFAGCSSYSWRSNVPEKMRTVAVPNFRNESTITELGPLVTRQVLREFQREGTYRLASVGDSALEIQGTIQSAHSRVIAYNLRSDRHREMALEAYAIVSVINKRSGQVLINNRKYSARTTYLSMHDSQTAARDASGRLAEDFSQQIVDDVLALKW